MVHEKEIQHLNETSQVKLRITVKKEDVKAEYEKLLKNYAKTARIDGFRKGKVPPSVLERKFGEDIKIEAAQHIMETALSEVFSEIEEKPLATDIPKLEEGSDIKPDFERDFQFTVTYDVYPKIQLGSYRGLEVEQPVVKITEEDEKRELEALVEQNSFVVEKDGEASQGDIATVNYWEVNDEGNEIPQSRRSDYTFTIGNGQTLFDFDSDVIGMKKGETRTITKTFPSDYRIAELAGTTKRISVELVTLKEKKRPELNDELAQDISEKYKTLDDLKKDIRKRLEETAQNRVRAITIEGLMDKVLAQSSLVVPQSMLQAELEHTWQHFLEQNRMDENVVLRILQAQGKTKEDLFKEWKPQAEKSLKVRLLIEEMIKKEQVDATEEEIDALIKEQAANVSMQPEELRAYYEKNGYLESIKHDIKEKKLFDALLADTKIVPGAEVKFVDIFKGNR
ncbi:MAG: trigger factor [Spirochaetes bacterium]|nr:trigger factor [Spirochaetota bacterium]